MKTRGTPIQTGAPARTQARRSANQTSSTSAPRGDAASGSSSARDGRTRSRPDRMGTDAGAKAALRALALDVRSQPADKTSTKAGEAASLGARLLAFTKTDGFRKGATVAALGLTLLGAAKPAMAQTVLVDTLGSSEQQRGARGVGSGAGAGPASPWVLNDITRAIRGQSAAPLTPQQALIEARLAANRTERTTAAADATRVAMPIRRPVGAGQPNHEEDVRVVQQRLSDLGFHVDVDGDFGPSTLKALRTVSALVEGKELVRNAGVRVVPDSTLHRCMESESLPRWTTMAESGPGFRNIDADNHDYGWSSVVDAVHGAGQRYSESYLAANPNASPILTNDASLRLGGNTPDHASHEVGLDLDIRLPNKAVPGAPTRVGHSSYDRDTARAQIQAFIAEGTVERVLTGDSVLLREFQRSSDPDAAKVQDGGRSHRDHIHVDVAAPKFV